MRSWWQLLRRHGFAVDARYLYFAAVDTVVSIVNSALAAIEHALYARRVSETKPPEIIFIVGHWRSGTTLLHELLCLDPRHVSPTTYECLAPHHFLLTESVLPRLLKFLMPERRPVDDMKLGWTSPFEDEFALCLLGARSPYETIAFPRTSRLTPALLDPDALTPGEAQAWRETMLSLMRKLGVRYPGRRLVLKSPPHTCRIRVLLELFPTARFVHIVRDPLDVFPSTLNLWRTLHRTQGLQRPSEDGLDESVLATFEYMHACIERDRSLLPQGRFHELRYEDLIREPVEELSRLHAAISIDPCPQLAEAVRAYFAERADYRTNVFAMTPAQRNLIHRRWAHVIARYGYDGAPGAIKPESSAAMR